MSDPLRSVQTRATPQSQPAQPGQVANSAGGYVFALDDLARLRRFLTLGVDAGTYYVAERELTKDNAAIVVKLAESDPKLVVDEIVAVSTSGRAPRQNPALFALAVVAGLADDQGRAYALSKLSSVARTGTHLAKFAGYVQQFRGWGRQLRRAVGGWYLDKTPDALAYQVLKYRQREGWTHRDLLRKAHPEAADPAQASLFNYIAHRDRDDGEGLDLENLPGLVQAYEAAQTATTPQLANLIARYPLSWEMLPNDKLNDAEVWAALLDRGLPITALLRQLPRLTRLGLLEGEPGRSVAERLADPAVLSQGRVHPVSVLVALRTYASGHGARGSGEWTPVARIIDALDAGFYAAFKSVEPTGRRIVLALDVSGSMVAPVSGLPLSAREASAALALVPAATEADHRMIGFTAGGDRAATTRRGAVSELAISPRQRLDDVLKSTAALPFAGTDCALPMLWALDNRVQADLFVIYTDNETWAGPIHPAEALRRYREMTGIPAKLAVVGMTSTGFSIADPSDAGMLDVAGFDAAVPNVIADFARQ
jgi:60 kDa SS-A/Ro ribonucleoprotein